jgi:hypothetical protein
VPADVARQEAAEKIVAGAGLVADDDAQRLAAVEFRNVVVSGLRRCSACG